EARAKARIDQARTRQDDSGDGEGLIAIIFFAFLGVMFLSSIFGRRKRGRRYRGSGIAGDIAQIALWSALSSGSRGGWGGGGGGSSWGGGGGFSGGGGSFGGGGASGSW